MDTYHKLIPKKAIRDLEKFIADLAAFAAETGEEFPTLYEDAFTTFEVRRPALSFQGVLTWEDERGEECREAYITEDEDGEERWDRWYEWSEGLKYWRAGLRRAKRYWATDPDVLDKIHDGIIEDKEEES